MPYPLFIFENHLDKRSKQLIYKFLLERLKPLGYDTLCVEATKKITKKIEKDWPNTLIRLETQQQSRLALQAEATQLLKARGISFPYNLSEMSLNSLVPLMHQYVSSKKPEHVTRTIKDIAVHEHYLQLILQAKKQKFKIEGINIDENLYTTSPDGVQIPKENLYTAAKENERVNHFCQSLSTLYKQNKGIIFLCGYFHADLIIKMLQTPAYAIRAHFYTIVSPEILGIGKTDPVLAKFVTNPLNKKIILKKDDDVPRVASTICEEIQSSFKKQAEIESAKQSISSESRLRLPGFLRLKYLMWEIEPPNLIEQREKDTEHAQSNCTNCNPIS